jgi:hypothetical protein
MTHATTAFDQAVAIQHGMNGAFAGDRNPREPADQTFFDFASPPARVLVLHVQDVVLDLKRKLVGVAIRTPAPVGQPLNPAFLVAVEDLVAGLTGNAKLPAEFRRRLAGEPQTAFFHP